MQKRKEFTACVKTEIAKWRKVVQAAKVTLN